MLVTDIDKQKKQMSYFRSDYQVQIKKNFIESIKSAIQNPGLGRIRVQKF